MACSRNLLLFEAVDKRHNVLLLQASKHFHLPKCGLLHNLVIIRLFEFLNGN